MTQRCFNDVLTGSDKQGLDDYDKGSELTVAKAAGNRDGAMKLVYDGALRQECSVKLEIDYKDFFYVHGSYEGWSKLLLPTEAEKDLYGTDEPLKGIIATCFATCDFSCSKEALFERDVVAGTAEIQVNGQPVKSMTDFGDCYFLKGEAGHVWKANDDGRYEISVRVNDATKHVRFTSFMIW